MFMKECILPGQSEKNFIFGLDVDETLLNPLEKYQKIINRELGTNISVRDIELSGGLDNFFRELPIYKEFCKLADELRESSEFNSGLPVIEKSVENLEKIVNLPNVRRVFYLTTRPEKVLLSTKENLDSVGFPQAEIIARPSDILRADTAVWKQSVLEQMSETSDDEIIYIDDNIATAKCVCEKNSGLFKKIRMILYAGPISYTRIKDEHITSDPENYFYLANDWNQVWDICLQVFTGDNAEKSFR